MELADSSTLLASGCGVLQVKFFEKNDGAFQLASNDGRLRLGRNTRDASLGHALYKVSWQGEDGETRGTVEARETRTALAEHFVVHIDIDALQRSFSTFRTTLAPSEADEFFGAFAAAICELNRLRDGVFAERLRTRYIVVLLMPDGSSRNYLDGQKDSAT